MLTLLKTPPSDLGKRGEITKLSGVMDRATGDIADLRFYGSDDGKKTYLRVWEHDGDGGQGRAAWYLCEKPAVANDTPTTKK